MTNQEIVDIAMRQSAVDLNCNASDFMSDDNVVVISGKNAGARKYLQLPFECNLVYYGKNIVASVSERTKAAVIDYIGRYPAEHCFETPNLHMLDVALKPFNLKVCFMAEYFLPDMNSFKLSDCRYSLKIIEPPFDGMYLPQWSNALCERRAECDVLAVGAFDKGRLVGLAGASADCESMWQIGVDVLPEYRRQGIAAALTSGLAAEVFKRGKVPFYCAAWANIGSVKNAIACGFRPAWAELTAKEEEYVSKLNSVF